MFTDSMRAAVNLYPKIEISEVKLASGKAITLEEIFKLTPFIDS